MGSQFGKSLTKIAKHLFSVSILDFPGRSERGLAGGAPTWETGVTGSKHFLGTIFYPWYWSSMATFVGGLEPTIDEIIGLYHLVASRFRKVFAITLCQLSWGDINFY